VRGIAPGTRIRVSAVAAEDRMASRDANDKRWQVGVLHEVTEDGLVLQTNASRPDALVTLPFGVIQDVEVSSGRLDVRRGTERGAMQGLAGGALAGGVFAGIVRLARSCPSGQACTDEGGILDTRTGALARDVALPAAVGAILGAVAGTRAREVWEPAARHVSVAPARTGGAGLGLSFRF